MGDTVAQYKKYMVPIFEGVIEPIVVESAEGATIRDTSGKEYVDCFSGFSVVNVGHRHAEVVRAARGQMGRYAHVCSYSYYAGPVGDLVEKLAQIAPRGLEKSFLCNSGAEAVEGAMKLARKYTGRKEFVALEHSFHGRTYGALSLTGKEKYKRGMGPFLSGVAFAPAPYCFRCRLGGVYPECDLRCARAVGDVLESHTAGDVAAVFVEPVLGEGGIIVPPCKGYFDIVAKAARGRGALLVVDEVQTGFGRTGKMFACEHWGIEPDIMTLAKGMGGGLPLGAFVTRAEVADAFKPGDHFSTFGGNPVCCAASLAAIEALEGGLIQRAEELGRKLGRWLRELKGEFPLVGDVRGIGLMYGVELADPETRAPLPDAAADVKSGMRDMGFLVGKGGYEGSTIRIQPPLVIGEDQLAGTVDAMGACISALRTPGGKG